MNKYEIRLVGGSVRDHILGLQLQDIDISVAVDINDIYPLFEQPNLIGLAHGSIQVYMYGYKIDITQTRKDVKCFGRTASVQFHDDWLEDAKRRDFTINAMSIGVDGKLYDYFNGYNDLHNHIIKFIGNPYDRIKEDYIRILRYFRFFARFGRAHDSQALAACKELRSGLSIIANERYLKEISLILMCNNAIDIICIMHECNIIKEIQFLKRWILFEESNTLLPSLHRRLAALSQENLICLSKKAKKVRDKAYKYYADMNDFLDMLVLSDRDIQKLWERYLEFNSNISYKNFIGIIDERHWNKAASIAKQIEWESPNLSTDYIVKIASNLCI